MARNESVSDLYVRLGLSLDDLEAGFTDAERTLRDNMSRLSRANRIIELQMQADLTGLDELADAERILRVRTDALNRQLEVQRDRVRLASAELRNMAAQHGATSDQAQRARLQYEQERLALARLEEQLSNVSDTQAEAGEGAGRFAQKVGAIAVRAAPVIAALASMEAATTELIEGFRELQTQSYELNMPFQQTKDFLRQLRLAGGDIGDFEGYIRGITDAYVKGEVDDPEFIALSKYGAQITDATGRLKDFQSITEEVYLAYLKAKEAGEEIEFLQLTGGEAGVRDSVEYFERYAQAKEDAAKIFDSGIDPAKLQEADRALNLLTEQLGEFKNAAVNMGIERTTAAMQSFFEVLRAGTELVVKFDAEMEKHKEPISAAPFYDAWLSGGTDAATFNRDLTALEEGLKATTVSWADFRKAVEDADKAASARSDNNVLSQYGQQRVNEFRAELEQLRIELDYATSEYEKAKALLDLWRKNEIDDKLHLSDEERLAIEELYSAKLEKIERDRADKLEEIREEVAQADRTALENKIAALEKAKEAWISAGMEEAEAAELAERQKVDAITEIEEAFAEKVDALRQTGLEKTLAAIEKEKQAWRQKGIDEVRAVELAEQQKADAQRNAALNALKSQIKEMRAFTEGGYGGLQEFYRHQLFQQGILPEELMITPQQVKEFEQARDMATRSLLPNFMTDEEREENQQLEKEWAERYRQKVNEVKGYAIDNTGKVYYLPHGTPHHFPYEKGKSGKWELDKDKAYQLGVDRRLEDYYGKNRIRDSFEGLNIGEELALQLERDLEKINAPLEEVGQELKQALTEALTETAEEISETRVLGAAFDYDEELTPYENTLSALYDTLSSLVSPIGDFEQQLQTLHDKIVDFVENLAALDVPKMQQKQPTQNNITNNISINEAHAWDMSHIQALADRVADVMTPALVAALGGDDNAY